MRRLIPARLRFAFRLRSVLIAISVLCLVLGGIAWRWRVLYSEVDAVSKLQAFESEGWQDPPGATPRIRRRWNVFSGPGGQKDALPRSVTAFDVIAVWRPAASIRIVTGMQWIRDDELLLCNAFRRLEVLGITESNLTDQQFALITATADLFDLQLVDNPLHDVSARRIAKMSKLQCLGLAATKVTDVGVHDLATLPILMSLDLRFNAAITDRSARCLAECRTLEALYLDQTAITDKGLMYLATLPKLCALGITETSVTLDGIRRFNEARLARGLEPLDLDPKPYGSDE